MEQYIVPFRELIQIAPEIILTIWSTAILLGMVFIRDKAVCRKASYAFACLGVILAGVAWAQQAMVFVASAHPEGIHYAFNRMYSLDGLCLFFKGLFLVSGLLIVLISQRFLDEERAPRAEFYGLLLLSMTAMMLLAGSCDLITIYINLEFMAISVYVLVGYLKFQPRSTEASLKYFILGAFSSALILFGMSFIYGLTGTTNLEAIYNTLSGPAVAGRPLLVLAMLLMMTGLGFKVAAVPFHMWCPDAYEGAPTPFTAFMSVAPKAAAFAIFLRLFMFMFKPLFAEYVSLLGLLAIVTMTVGNILAVKQTNIKRMLAYSSISHAGYLLMGLMVREYIGVQAIGVYLISYLFMNIGVFSIVVFMRRRDIVGDDVEDYSGLMQSHPGLAVSMTIFLLSLAGIPPTAGFIAKYWVFATVIKAYLVSYDRLFFWVALAGALNAVVALYYYCRIIRRMFMSDAREIPPPALGLGSRIALGVTLAGTLGIGLYPEPVIQMANWIQMTFIGIY